MSLANKYDQSNDAKRVAKAAQINTAKIKLNGSSVDLWEEIIQAAEKSNRLVGLLEFVTNPNEKAAEDDDCRNCLSELTTGVPTRVQKLAQSIADGRCVLFLGSGTLLCNVAPIDDPEGPAQLTVFNQALAQSMAKELQDNSVYFDPRESRNLPYIAQRYNDLMLPGLNMPAREVPGLQGKLAKQFYESCDPDPRLHELVAQLPFRVVINTNPDAELATILNNLPVTDSSAPRPRCVHRYYNMTNADGTATITPRPLDPGQTLLYNIFGSFEDRPSIILTESQLLDFTSRILNKTPAIDPQVMEEFTVSDTPPKSYLFLGFDFDQWYVKIVFQTVLKLIKQKDRAFSIFPKGISYSVANREFFEEEFKCYFIDDDITRFLKDLIKMYQDIRSNL